MSSGSSSSSRKPSVTDFFLKDLAEDSWVCQVVVGETEDGQPKRCQTAMKAADDVNQKGIRIYYTGT